MVQLNSAKPWAASGPARIWRPEIRETNEEGRPYSVNLEHSNDSRPPQGFNSAALPFETDARVKHLQYNSPLGLYSDSTAAEQYIQQTQGYVDGDQRSARNVAQKDTPSYLRSEALKQIKEEEGRGASTLSSHPNPEGLPVCFACQRPILGVMARAQGRDLHGDCLACATCGNSLRNVGHHFIDEKFYCDVHAAQKRSSSRGPVDPNLMSRVPPTAAQPTRPSEPPRSFYQSEVLSSRPLSVSPVPAPGTTVITHYHTPKTQGIINSDNRGVPKAIFGADLQKVTTHGGNSSTGMGGTVYGGGPPPSNQNSGMNYGGNYGGNPGYNLGRDGRDSMTNSMTGSGYGANAIFGQGGGNFGPSNYNSSSSQQHTTRNIPVQHQQAPPPIPSSQPPNINTQVSESRVPTSLRSAVSPRKTGKAPRPWPPPPAAPTNKYWQIEPAIQIKLERSKDEPRTLEEMIREDDCKAKPEKSAKKSQSRRSDPRRRSQISGGDVRVAISQSQQPEATVSTNVCASRSTPEIHVTGPAVDPPKIVDGIHWTVIHSPESPKYRPKDEPAQQQSPKRIIPEGTKTEPSQVVRRPIPVVANSKMPLKIQQANERRERKLEPPPIEIVSPIIKMVSRPQYMNPLPPELAQVPPVDQHSPMSVSSATSDIPDVSRPTYIVDDIDVTAYLQARDAAIRMKRGEEVRRMEEERRLFEEMGKAQISPSMQLLPSRTTTHPVKVIEEESQRSQAAAQGLGLLKPIETIDSSTSPIPMIQFDRHHQHPHTSQVQEKLEASKKQEAKKKKKMTPQSSEDKPEKSGKKVGPVQVHKMVSVWEQQTADRPQAVSHAPVKSSTRGGDNKKELVKPLRKVDFSKEQQPQQVLGIVQGQSVVVQDLNSERQGTMPPAPPLRRDSPAQVLQQISRPQTLGQRDYPDIRRDLPPPVPNRRHLQQQGQSYREEWAEVADIVDESDILTVTSVDDDTRRSEQSQMRASYDGDSESLQGSLDAMEEERDRLLQGNEPEDETQSERDLRIVAALNARLQDIREMEEADRVKAIECIERHQRSLEQQQDQLSHLLDSAIEYLKHLDERVAEKKAKKSQETQELEEFGKLEKLHRQIQELKEGRDLQEVENKPPTPPARRHPFVKTDSLNEALEELGTIKITPAAKFISQKINERLEAEIEGNQGGYTRTTTERTVMNGAGNGYGGMDYPPGGQTTFNSNTARTVTSGSLNSGGGSGRVPYCEACKQQIRGAFVLATGLAWCPEHFVCANPSCGRRLLECGFVEEGGRKYCEGCFESHIAPRCAKCTKPIVSDCLNALQKKWHPTCFVCAHCQKPFGNSAFYLEQGLPYCEKDWNMLFTTKCVSCSYPIEAGDRWVEALGQAFHSNCFNCSRCHTNLEGESFYARNGQPFCRLHA